MACNWGKCPPGRGSLASEVEIELDGDSWVIPVMPDERDDVSGDSLYVVGLTGYGTYCFSIYIYMF